MLNNTGFLEVVRQSFKDYLSVDTSRSTKKLQSLHGSIAADLQEIFGNDFSVKAQGFGQGRESTIFGRYYPKKTDITIECNGKPVAGYAVKFVMRNYSQNSNNYFENMLGETANIRCQNIPYFEIFILFDTIPYYTAKGAFKKYDIISPHNLDKYFQLSKDNPDIFFHTPDKTLIVLLTLKDSTRAFQNSIDYAEYYENLIDDADLITYSAKFGDTFGDSVILNNYQDFIRRTYYTVLGKMKQ